MSETEKQKQKDRILTELYNSGIVQKKVEAIAYRNYISPDNLIYQDIIQEVFYQISKKSPDFIIKNYYQFGTTPTGTLSNLVALCVRIAIWRGVSKDPKNPDYHNHSLAPSILFSSNFKNATQVSSTENIDESEERSQELVLQSPPEVSDTHELWETIRSNLTAEEITVLDYHLNLKKGRGRYKKAVKEQYNELLIRIKDIITVNKIRI